MLRCLLCRSGRQEVAARHAETLFKYLMKVQRLYSMSVPHTWLFATYRTGGCSQHHCLLRALTAFANIQSFLPLQIAVQLGPAAETCNQEDLESFTALISNLVQAVLISNQSNKLPQVCSTPKLACKISFHLACVAAHDMAEQH